MKLSKSMVDQLETAFDVLRENIDSKVTTNKISEILKTITGLEFSVSVIQSKDTNNNDAMWVMSVYPEISTIDKIINNINSMDDKTIQKLWEKNKVWTIEIDQRIFFNSSLFTSREMSAMLLHEIGHVIYSNSITSRISNILNYEIAKNRHLYHGVVKTGIFRSMLSLPILNLCVSSQSKDKSLKNEIKADKFAAMAGYRKELESAFTKIINYSKGVYGSTDIDDNLKTNMKFTGDSIEQFKARKDKLMKKNLFNLRENCESDFMEHRIDTIIDDIFLKEGTSEDDDFKINHNHKILDNLENEYLSESFIGNKFAAIDPSTFDYIDVKTMGIKSLDDKMMLAVYVQSKLDIINNYIRIAESGGHKAKKIPYTLDELYVLKDRLLNQKSNIIDAKIPSKHSGLLVAWPDGYDG